MIYTRFGLQIEIYNDCGKHQPGGVAITLVYVKRVENGDFRYCFAETLRADEGWKEISEAVEKADVRNLQGKELEAAIQQAL